LSAIVNQGPIRDVRAGFESALHGLSTLVIPGLLFAGILGPLAGRAGLWGTLLAVTIVPVIRLMLGGANCVVTAPRTASTATYVAMILHFGLADSSASKSYAGSALDISQLHAGIAAATLMYLLASVLVTLSGLLRLGRVFKMIPIPVTTGISNGTALLLLSLAFGKLSGGHLTAVGVSLAMVISYFAWAWVQSKLTMAKLVPVILLPLCVGTLLTAWAGNLQVESIGNGWQRFTEGLNWSPILLWNTLDIRHLATLTMLGLPGAITLALVMVLETFTTASTLETRFGPRCDPDRELVALGGANVAGALLGSVPCTGSTVYSVASWLGGGRGRLAPLTCLAVGGIAIIFSITGSVLCL